MKKLFLLIILSSAIFISSSAQDVGQMWVGGSVGFWSNKIKSASQSQTSYKILPEFGYVISENLGIGISGGYVRSQNYVYSPNPLANSHNFTTHTTTGYSIAPFVRYTFLKGDIGGLFLDGGFGYTHSQNKDNDNYKSNSIEVGVRPGVAINVSSKISLLGKFGFLGYEGSKSEQKGIDPVNKEEHETNGFGFDLNMDNVLLGINFKF